MNRAEKIMIAIYALGVAILGVAMYCAAQDRAEALGDAERARAEAKEAKARADSAEARALAAEALVHDAAYAMQLLEAAADGAAERDEARRGAYANAIEAGDPGLDDWRRCVLPDCLRGPRGGSPLALSDGERGGDRGTDGGPVCVAEVSDPRE